MKQQSSFLTLAPIAIAVTLSACSAYAGNANRPQDDDDKVLWTSASSSAHDFARELSELYSTLYTTGRLSLRRNVIAQSDNIEEVLRDNGNLVGPEFPEAIDSLVCDLNANICQRSHTLRASGSSSFGFIASPTLWKLKRGDSLVLPAIRLTMIPKWVPVPVGPKQPISYLVTEVLGGCIDYDSACRQSILKYNRKLDEAILTNDSKTFTGNLSLPVVAARATVDISSAEEGVYSGPPVREDRPGQALELTPSFDGSFKVKNFGASIGATIGSDTSVQGIPEKSAVIKNLRPNSIGGASNSIRWQAETPPQAKISALFPTDFDKHQKDISNLIVFPYRTLAEYPSLLRGATVGIFDSWVDNSHCAFEGARFQVHNLSTRQSAAAGSCNEQTTTGDVDHGTHIAGLIAGRLPAGHNFGLNPYANLISYEVDFSKLSDPAELIALATNIEKMPNANAEVVNLSFGYMLDPQRGIQDPVQSAIISQQDRTLFVMAAGNYGTDVSYICDQRPTCFDLPNVIVVGALNRSVDSPKLYTAANGKLQTNYGSRVHVAAIGEDVFSTVAFGRYGVMSGSSFAAPQVAAVASLLMRKYRKLSPQEVKNRLVYCSDHVGALGDRLFGGRLNAKCTLDGDSGSLLLSTADAGKAVAGFFQAGSTAKFRDRENGRVVQMPVEVVRAVHFDQNRQVFTVYFNADKSSDSRLLRETNLVPDKDTDTMTFILGGVPKSVRTSEIVRYTSSVK
ncbi:S8/S53 family peptidase [Bradyrhizobium sp. SRL28]|uniref:S8 family peptidase n=1 Tax=Bradyrhizobium sp. SRL28 TaxID=2836178 RepID=UPI001BDE69DD|nr:S8/S53 family peptidase [Bradyrhizobium sp. SRL28]MBT1508869.1 S8/S53 family peptidase [Bradyrhizobium sp. SRL28]